MAKKIIAYDTVTGKNGSITIPASVPVDQEFTVGAGGQSRFTITATFASGNVIDVFKNGVLTREGSGFDFQRNTGLNSIDFNYTIPQDAWVKIRVYS